MPVILAFRRLRQEDYKFETILGYIVSSRSAQNKTWILEMSIMVLLS